VRASPRFRGGLRLAALTRLAGGRGFAAGRRLPLVRRSVAVRRLAVRRRFAVVRRFTCAGFFRAEREVAARFLPFAICCLRFGAPSTLLKKTHPKGGKMRRYNRNTKVVSLARILRYPRWTKGWDHLRSEAPPHLDFLNNSAGNVRGSERPNGSPASFVTMIRPPPGRNTLRSRHFL
jgi:hypothetical protein